MIKTNDQKLLLNLARDSIRGAVSLPAAMSDSLKRVSRVFVTLAKKGELRGCIGCIEATRPLYQAVIECARDAAYHDFRFVPVSSSEIDSLSIEISVLSEPADLKYSSAEELLQKLNHKLGVIIRKVNCCATFLPQVWEELPEKTDFLSHLCAKAGLPPDAWEKRDLEISTYTVEKFSE